MGTPVRLTRGVGADLVIRQAELGGECLEKVLLAVNACVAVLGTGLVLGVGVRFKVKGACACVLSMSMSVSRGRVWGQGRRARFFT